ncbi:hypothetical protein DSO57_1034662 [Entomophthora muscae]|uniref:Uncharacterized protein n=1 Tax=Entomophthora muscae TaxID=34485 RepID=A0ACC2SPJ9_9FUNG|nr:hypothetical protein DSO57_1034662 [Entomophthora muscae]
MNHLIFSAVLTACLGIGGQQYNHQHGPYNKLPDKYFYEEPAQLNSSKQYSWPMLVLPRSTQHIAIYTCVYYVLTYFAGNFRRFNIHTKVFIWMMTVYPIVTALTGFQVTNLYNALKARRLFPTTPTTTAPTQPEIPNIMFQRLCTAEIGAFEGLHRETLLFRSTAPRASLNKWSTPQRLWVSKISLCVTGTASRLVTKWLAQHPDQKENWEVFKAAFLKKFSMKDLEW